MLEIAIFQDFEVNFQDFEKRKVRLLQLASPLLTRLLLKPHGGPTPHGADPWGGGTPEIGLCEGISLKKFGASRQSPHPGLWPGSPPGYTQCLCTWMPYQPVQIQIGISVRDTIENIHVHMCVRYVRVRVHVRVCTCMSACIHKQFAMHTQIETFGLTPPKYRAPQPCIGQGFKTPRGSFTWGGGSNLG